MNAYETLRRALRYCTVGLLLNVLGYGLYIFVTWLGLEPKVAVSIFYPLGVVYGYFAHKSLSFRHKGDHAFSGARFLLAQMGGYLLNLALLAALVDHFGIPHQIVQACAIVLVAIFLFLSFHYFVFPAPPHGEKLDCP